MEKFIVSSGSSAQSESSPAASRVVLTTVGADSTFAAPAGADKGFAPREGNDGSPWPCGASPADGPGPTEGFAVAGVDMLSSLLARVGMPFPPQAGAGPDASFAAGELVPVKPVRTLGLSSEGFADRFEGGDCASADPLNPIGLEPHVPGEALPMLPVVSLLMLGRFTGSGAAGFARAPLLLPSICIPPPPVPYPLWGTFGDAWEAFGSRAFALND
mmetsp:Transcript_18086/g.72376  ORF Transcript_18086/g.72376 Transcript_18086/m.72376 type:complete len:216 (-) Transcript_18086:375-1022(-)